MPLLYHPASTLSTPHRHARESSHPPRFPMRSEDFRRLSPSHASCRRLRRVPVCGPVHRAYCCGNCFHIKHKKCKILCYEHIAEESRTDMSDEALSEVASIELNEAVNVHYEAL